MTEHGRRDAPEGSAPEEVVALERRIPDRTVAKTMNVDLPPAEVLATLLGLDPMQQRSPGDENRFERRHLTSTIFYERTSEGIVLWRRPDRHVRRTQLDPLPYPDMLDVRIEALPRGSRIELRWRRHPMTRFTMRWTVGATVVFVLAAALWMLLAEHPFLVVVGLGSSLVTLPWVIGAHWRAYRDRYALQPLFHRAHAALAPHELGRADIEGSAFRALPPQARGTRSRRGRRR